MTDQENKQVSEVLGKIELTLSQMLDTQREGSQAQSDWIAADLRLREKFLENQRALIETNIAAQRAHKRSLLMTGMLAAIMLMVGVALLTEPWWMPVVMGAH